MIDTLAVVETPEGIALQLRSAGALPRACVWALDLMLRFALMFVASIVLGMLGSSGIGLFLLVLFAVSWLYPVLFEVLRNGQTPGKRVMKLRVVNANGTPVTWLASIVRNLLRVVDVLPLCYGFGLVASLCDAQGRRIGDLVARTLVVYVESPLRAAAMPATPAVAPPAGLLPAERAALVEFAERSARLTPERQQELADLLAGLTHARGAVAVQRLHGMATACVGRA